VSPRNEARVFAVFEAVGATVGAADEAEGFASENIWDDGLLVKLDEGDIGGVKVKEFDGVPNPVKPPNLEVGVEEGCEEN
jgi:hypothetical protein